MSTNVVKLHRYDFRNPRERRQGAIYLIMQQHCSRTLDDRRLNPIPLSKLSEFHVAQHEIVGNGFTVNFRIVVTPNSLDL